MKIFKLGVLLSPLLASSSYANYPDFNSSNICNGYSSYKGIVDYVTATTGYSSTLGVYVRIKTTDNKYLGGKIYQRSDLDYAYNHMVKIALLSSIMKTDVKICVNGDEIYALEYLG